MPLLVTVHVDAAAPGETVPPQLFGAFVEPIGNSINNGLMAQIVVNPSFESGLWDQENLKRLLHNDPALTHLGFIRGLPLPWLPWNANAGNRYETHVGNAANSYQSMELLGVPGAAVGLMQHVYVPVQRTRRYVAAVYARRLAGSGEITFALRNQSGRELAHANASVQNDIWTKLSAPLELPKDSISPREKVDFGVYIADASRIEIDQLTLTPADAVDGFDPDVIALAKQMGMTELRFGGNFSSFYHWRDGIGNPDARKTMINVGWGIPEYNNFGTDEFLQLCRDLNAIPQINVNMGSGTAGEAADWVRYIRKRYRGPVIWELGNELWGPWQVGPPTLEQLPARTLAFSKAVRAASLGDEIIAMGSTPTEFANWNAQELSLPQGTFDDLSLHFVETSGRDETWKPRTVASTYMVYAKSYHVGETFGPLQRQVESTPHRNHVHFAMTEWLFNSMAEGEGNFTNDFPAWNNLGGAVAAAGFLNTLLRHTAEIRIADMTGMIEFAGIAKHREIVYAQPCFYVFQMYSGIKGQHLLPVHADSGSYVITEPNYLFPKGGEIPFLDVVATENDDGKQVTLLIVNRSIKKTSVKLELDSWKPKHIHLT